MQLKIILSIQAITSIIVAIYSQEHYDMLIIVQVERQLCLLRKTCDLNFQRYRSKNYITLKLVRGTIKIFNQPHQYRFCTVVYGPT